MISIVIPLHNEQANLAELHRRLLEAAPGWADPFEVIFVDDGSRDGTADRCRALCRDDSRFRLLSLTRNFGQQPSICAGLAHAQGDRVVVMDGDLQDPPEMIRSLLDKLDEGFDVAYAVRRKRKEPPLKKLLYFLFYRVLRRVSKVEIPADAGDFCAMDARVVQALNSLPEVSVFVRGLRAWVGFRQAGVPYERAGRGAGSSQYGWGKLLDLALHGLFGFSRDPSPLLLLTGSGFLLAAGGTTVLFTIAWASGAEPLASFSPVTAPVVTLTVVTLFALGLALLCLGVATGYLHRVLEEVRGRPAFVVRDRYGFDGEAPLTNVTAATVKDAGDARTGTDPTGSAAGHTG